MGFFLGFFFGIGAGVAFSEWGLNYPLDYIGRPDGFGKVTVDLEVFNPAYNTFKQVRSYFDNAKNRIVPSPRSAQSQMIADSVSKTIEAQTDAAI